MNGWTEDESTDVRTRDLAARRAQIMNGAEPWGVPSTHHVLLDPDVPRRVDWWRVAAIVIVILAACATVVALGAALVLILTW